MPSLDERDTYDAGRMAALLGVHLVSQVLDEAMTIANAAQNIGWPQTCVLSFFKDMKSDKLTVSRPIKVAQENKEIVIDDKKDVSNLATSTPHKDDEMKLKLENSIIGQGDEEIDMRQNELSTSTSMFINHLFDMSEVENEVSCEEITSATEVTEIVNNDSSMISILDELFHIAFDIASGHENIEVQEKENSESPEESCYSFLEDANEDDDSQDVAFYVDNNEMPPVIDKKGLACGDLPSFVDQINLQLEEEEKLEKSNVARFENAYLSLNRDYEQCSDDGDPVLQDPKGLLMHDVELLTASTSDENISSRRESEEARKQLAAISGVSGVSGSRKSRGSLVSRCRSQGARLLACLRGWWRRKTPGKRKEGRHQGSIRGMCPLSPDARRRAASLLDSRQLYSHGVPHSVVWKFNTVNEALVNSSRWKEYTFEVKPDECGEY